jgi:hypothetical protein
MNPRRYPGVPRSCPEAGDPHGDPAWGGPGVGESGGHPRRGISPRPQARCLRPLRQQAAKPWSHLHVQEQLVVMANATVAAPAGVPRRIPDAVTGPAETGYSGL